MSESRQDALCLFILIAIVAIMLPIALSGVWWGIYAIVGLFVVCGLGVFGCGIALACWLWKHDD